MANYRTADAAMVREWARGEGMDVGERGRINSEVAAAFNDAHKRQRIRYGGSGNTTAAATAAPAKKAAPAPRQRTAPVSGEVMPAGHANATVMGEVESFGDIVRALSATAKTANKKDGTPVVLSAHVLTTV